jgi:hypothetical protein
MLNFLKEMDIIIVKVKEGQSKLGGVAVEIP